MTGEQALRQFLLALGNNDREGLEAISLPHEDLGILLETQSPLSEAQLAEAVSYFSQAPIRPLAIGDTFTLPDGRQVVIDESFVNESRLQFLVDEMPIPFAVIQSDGRWRVDPGPLIAARQGVPAFQDLE